MTGFGIYGYTFLKKSCEQKQWTTHFGLNPYIVILDSEGCVVMFFEVFNL